MRSTTPIDAEVSMDFAPQQGFVEAARRVYDERLRSSLEAEHPGKIIAIEPQSGDYVLGATTGEVDRACRQRFGAKPVHLFRVGGGGAVKIGGVDCGRTS